MILSSWWPFSPERNEDKITFSLVYRTLFFDTTCEKQFDLGHAFLLDRVQNLFFDTTCEKQFDLGHAFLLDRVQNRALRTECEKILFDTRARLVIFEGEKAIRG